MLPEIIIILLSVTEQHVRFILVYLVMFKFNPVSISFDVMPVSKTDELHPEGIPLNFNILINILPLM